MFQKPFKDVAVEPPREPVLKRRYSVTSDIAAFRRCPRQYGRFRQYDFAPAQQTQFYYGTIIHQVLDRCHGHYHGVQDPSTKGEVPDGGAIVSESDIRAYFTSLSNGKEPDPPSELVGYFVEVENGLKSRGIHAVSPKLRFQALNVLQYFNALEGETLYPNVVDTEHRLQADRDDHIMHGVVDLLVSGDKDTDDPANGEIWDYKGSSRISLTEADLRTYQFQMQVYAQLYKLKHGHLPERAVLYFVNELSGDTPPTQRPANALLEISIDADEIEEAMANFHQSVQEIEASRENDLWLPADYGEISEQTCAICDLRWNCPTPKDGGGVKMRYP